MKKIIYIILIILIIGIIIWQNIYKRDEQYMEVQNESTLNNAINSVINIEHETIKVHISGEVLAPGVIKVEEGSRIIDVVEKAGGLLEDADVSRVNLAYKVNDGEKINIPSIYDKEEITVVQDDAGEKIIDSQAKESGKVNINQVSRRRAGTFTGNWTFYSSKDYRI